MMATSRLEKNFLRLLVRCESMAGEKREEKDWRLEKRGELPSWMTFFGCRDTSNDDQDRIFSNDNDLSKSGIYVAWKETFGWCICFPCSNLDRDCRRKVIEATENVTLRTSYRGDLEPSAFVLEHHFGPVPLLQTESRPLNVIKLIWISYWNLNPE
eukprot:g46548.t1